MKLSLPAARLPLEILVGVAIIILGLWLLVALLAYQSYRQAIDSAATNGRNLARSLAEYQDSSVRAIDLSLQQLRAHWLRDRGSFAEAVAQHEEHLRKEKVIQIAVMDKDAWSVYSRLPLPASINFADRPYVQEMKRRGTDGLYISEPVIGRVTKRWAIQLSRPIFDAAQRYDGFIVVAVPPPALEGLLQEFDLGPNGVIALARADGTLLARSGGLPRDPQVSFAGWPAVGDDASVSGEFWGPSPVDGVRRFYAYRKLPSYPLTVLLGQGADTVLASYYRDRNLLVASAGLGSVLLIALALLLMARSRERARFAEERERVMLELHDTSIQSIYAIGLTLENSRRMLEKDPAQASRTLAEAEANLNLVIHDLRTFITGERRASYSEQEFMTEIERIVPPPDQGPRFSVEVDRSLIGVLKPRQAENVLRIAREAVSNTVRHADARNGRLVLRRQGDRARLEVSDDGIGIPAQQEARHGLGLHHIEARARKLSGQATFEAPPGGGTRVAVEFPCRA